VLFKGDFSKFRSMVLRDAGRRTLHDWGQIWPSLALNWAKHKPIWAQLRHNLGRTRASWLQFGPNLSTTGPNTFGQVGVNMRNSALCGGIWRRSWAQDRPKCGEHGPAQPPSKPKKMLEIAVKNASLQLVIESAKMARVGPTKLRYLDATRTQVGANGSC
jgi:hypothetical protein